MIRQQHLRRAIDLIQIQIDLMMQQRDPNGFALPCLALDLAIRELHSATRMEGRA